MTNRSKFLVFTVAMGALLPIPVQGAQDSQSGGGTVNGTIYTASGTVAPGARVELWARDDSLPHGQKLLAATSTSRKGTFSAAPNGKWLSQSDISEVMRNHAGSLAIELRVTFAGGSTTSTNYVLSRSRAGLRYDDGKLTQNGVIFQQGLGSVYRRVVAPNMTNAAKVATEFRFTPKAIGTAVGAVGVAPGASASRTITYDQLMRADQPKYCNGGGGFGGGLYFKKSSKTKRRWAPMATFHTRKRTTAEYNWHTTEESRFEVATSGDASPLSAGWGSGGMTYASNSSAGAGIDASYGRRKNKRLTAQWRYRKYDMWCSPRSGFPFKTGEYEWRVENFTGGNKDVKALAGFKCKSANTTKIMHSVWASKEQAATWIGWFKLAGLSMTNSQGSSTYAKKTWNVHRKYKQAWICGRDSDPTVSPFVRER